MSHRLTQNQRELIIERAEKARKVLEANRSVLHDLEGLQPAGEVRWGRPEVFSDWTVETPNRHWTYSVEGVYANACGAVTIMVDLFVKDGNFSYLEDKTSFMFMGNRDQEVDGAMYFYDGKNYDEVRVVIGDD